MKNDFGEFPYLITMPPRTDKEDAELFLDNEEALKLFANQNRKDEPQDYKLWLVFLLPLFLLIIAAIVRGIMP